MKKFLNLCFFIAAALVFSACGKDDPGSSEFKKGSIPYQGESDRAYLESAANAFLGLVNPADQKTFITTMKTLSDLLETYPIPDMEYSAAPARAAARMAAAVEDGNVAGLGLAVSDMVLNMYKYKGLYQANPNLKQWQRIEDADGIDFRFWIGNTEWNLIIKGDGDTWSQPVKGANGTITAQIPKKITVALNQGVTSATSTVTQHMLCTITSDGKSDGSSLSITTNIKAANLVLESSFNATATSMSGSFTFSMDNVKTYYRTEVLGGKWEFGGRNLASLDNWLSVLDGEGSAEVTSASTTLLFMQRVQLKAKITDMTAVKNMLDGYDALTSAQAEDAASAMTRGLDAKVYYAGDANAVRATIGWKAGKTDGEWDVRPTITFTSDNVTYDMEEYFTDGKFLSIENQVKKLRETYRSYVK